MKLVRYLRRSFVGGRIVEPGEEMLVPDSTVVADHMVDVAAESAAAAAVAEVEAPAEADAPVEPEEPAAVPPADSAIAGL